MSKVKVEECPFYWFTKYEKCQKCGYQTAILDVAKDGNGITQIWAISCINDDCDFYFSVRNPDFEWD